jgi:hypothetical protein
MDMMPSESSQASPPPPGTLACILGNRGFLACAGLLIVFSVVFQAVATYRNVQFAKLPMPLKKPLDQLDQRLLAPYQLITPYIIKPEMLDTLGTKEYIQWLLQDDSRDAQGAEKLVNVFVTYYTGKPDQVPHIPDVCYRASGFNVADTNVREISIPGVSKDGIVPVKVVEFERSSLLGKQSRIVIYTFHCNGEFVPDRRDVQALVGSPFSKQAYFSKIELSFGRDEESLSREQAVRAAERCLRVLLPVLLRDHYPDWQPTGQPPRASGRDS